jgi:hypothetical protein
VSTSTVIELVRTAIPAKGQEAISRATRQAIQALIPTLVIVAGGKTAGIDVPAVALLASVTALVSILKSAASLTISPAAPVWQQIGERAVVAFAGSELGFLAVDGVVSSTNIPWGASTTASLGAAGIAIAMWFTNPPVVVRALTGRAAGSTYGGSQGPLA